jgi:hypothetical protein
MIVETTQPLPRTSLEPVCEALAAVIRRREMAGLYSETKNRNKSLPFPVYL